MAMVKPPCFVCHASREDLEYYKLPTSRELREAWTAAIGVAVDTVCSDHFVDDDYCHMRGRRRLRASAVPSRLLARKSPPPQIENETKIEDKPVTTDTNRESAANKNKNSKKRQSKKSKKSNKNTTQISASLPKAVNEKEVETAKDAICVKENGNASTESKQNEEDIEEMITNYQIKQTKALAARLHAEPPREAPAGPPSEAAGAPGAREAPARAPPLDSAMVAQLASRLENQLADLVAQPVFIEVAASKEAGSRAASPRDCLMLLESIQCEVDPSSLMLPERGAETDSDMEIVDTRKEDPISLLTSSDEDEVIIQEPHIDTVDVSDETDEDDRPLQRLVTPKPPPKPDKPVWLDRLAESLMPKLQCHWGVYQYYCETCKFRTESETEIKQHMKVFEHQSVPLQVCPTCNYATGSKAQFARHRRKHKDERNYKCHLCHYKARHNMSLMYHLKSHQQKERNPAFVCDKCGFSTDEKSEGLNHIKSCIDWVLFRCDDCSYSTKRRSDLKRHRQRRHSIDDDDADFAV